MVEPTINDRERIIKDIPLFLKRSKESHEYFCSKGLWILTDKMKLIPFVFNSAQRKMHKIAEEEKAKKGYVRIIVLKPRRLTATTYIASRAYSHFFLTPYTTTSVMAHEMKATNRIFKMLKIFHEQLKVSEQWEFIKDMKKSNAKEMESASDSMSYIEVFTAGKEHSSRSGGYTFIHASECAFYPSAEQMLNLMAGTKEEAGTEIWMESTANGIGNAFHAKWQSARHASNADLEKYASEFFSMEDFTPIFFAWFEQDEFVMPFKSTMQKEYFMESVHNHKYVEKYGEEEEEMKLYKLSYEQLQWRRYYIDNKCQGHPSLQPLDVFKQENPANEIEAFVTTGGCVFKTLILLHNQKLCKQPIARGGLRWKNIDMKEPDWFDDAGGEIKLWQLPDAEPLENRYAGGFDPSGGVLESDFMAGAVMDRLNNSFKIVATWHGYADPDKMAEQLYLLSLFYNADITWCIENNAYGNPVIKELFKKWNYNKQYMNRKLDRRKEKINPDILGFKTTSATKPILIQQLNAWIRDGSFTDYDEDFWKECLTFVYGKRLHNSTNYEMSAMDKGKRGSADRNYDDRVFARALAIEMHRVMSPVKKSFAKLPNWMKQEITKQREPKSYMTS